MRIIRYIPGDPNLEKLIKRSRVDMGEAQAHVRNIISDVKLRGDLAISDYLFQYDGIRLHNFLVSKDEVQDAITRLPKQIYSALKIRRENILKLHLRQKLSSHEYSEDGFKAGELVRPIESAGLYIPGGTASFPTVMQILATPAQIAGVKRIVACVPPRGATDAVLAAAELSGVTEIYRIGGVAAIAGLAYGTESLNKVDIIVGPGNIYVTAAKREVFGDVQVDMPAGPSEALIIAGPEANPEWVAIDVLARCEHDTSAASVVVTWDENLAIRIEEAVTARQHSFPKKDIIKESLGRYSAIILCANADEAMRFSNRYAPEHLEIMTNNADEMLKDVKNAGSVFLGHYTPVAVGDYLGVSNHVLPSTGYAKAFSPISVRTFQKTIQYESISPKALSIYTDTVMRPLAIDEGFAAHLASLEIRLGSN